MQNLYSELIQLLEADQALIIDDKLFKEFYLLNANSICRLQSHKNIEADKASRLLKDKVYEHFDKTTSKGLYYNGQVITPLSQGIKKVYSNQKYTQDLGMLLCDFWADIDFQNTQNEGGVSFPTAKKPEALIARIIDMATKENDIVLDYHLGSGTTCAVAQKMNRRYIGIEQLDYGQNDSVIRLKNVIEGEQSGISKSVNWKGGGSFVYAELMQSNQHYITQIQEAKSTEELLIIWDEMQATAFISYKVLPQNINNEINNFEALNFEEQQRFWVDVLDKNLLYVNKSEINDARHKVSNYDKEMNAKFYNM